MLEMMNEKCEKFLNWASDSFEPVCEYMNNYLSLIKCTILAVYIFTLIAIAYCLLIP